MFSLVPRCHGLCGSQKFFKAPSQAAGPRAARAELYSRCTQMPLDSDTDDRARSAQVTALRRLGSSGRLRLAAEMSEDARRISIEGERRRHPELTEGEARRVVLRRMWGAELAARVSVIATRIR